MQARTELKVSYEFLQKYKEYLRLFKKAYDCQDLTDEEDSRLDLLEDEIGPIDVNEMIMHDLELLHDRIQLAREVRKIHLDQPTVRRDDYMAGIANGMEWIFSVLDNRKPLMIPCPSQVKAQRHHNGLSVIPNGRR